MLYLSCFVVVVVILHVVIFVVVFVGAISVVVVVVIILVVAVIRGIFVIIVAIIVVFVVAIIVVLCWCLFCLLLCFCCYVDKQEGGNSTNPKWAPKSGTTSGQHQRGSYVSKCKNYGVFGFCFFLFFVVYMCVLQNTIKQEFKPTRHCFLVFFWVQKSWVNNWSTDGSIAGPHFGSYFLGTYGPVIDPRLLFQTFFLKLCFFQKSHSPYRKKKKGNGGPVIDPTKAKMWTSS